MMPSNVEAVREVRGMLIRAFDWADTPQGYEYWSVVMQNLLGVVSRALPRCPACHQHLPE